MITKSMSSEEKSAFDDWRWHFNCVHVLSVNSVYSWSKKKVFIIEIILEYFMTHYVLHYVL